jgi:hypothetical protein
MRAGSVRTSIDIPRELHRRVHEAAARKGCSARKLILEGIERAVGEGGVKRAKRRLNLDIPLFPLAERKIDPTDEQIYEAAEFP